MGSNNQPRSGKFYRKNEAEVMRSLGLKPTKNSGSGWIEKEDGQNDYIICQLKSTDAQSIRILQKDIRVLEENAAVVHKTPVFAIQFLNTNEVFIMCRPEDISTVAKYIETGACDRPGIDFGIDLSNTEDTTVTTKRVISSAGSARQQFHKEREKKFKKEKKAT